MRVFLMFLLLPLVVRAQEPKPFRLDGQLNFGRPVQFILLEYGREKSVRDSVAIEGQSAAFSFRGVLSEPTMATLKVAFRADGGPVNGQQCIVFLEPGDMKISTDDSLKSARVTGSATHDEYLQLLAATRPAYQKRDSLMKLILRAIDEKNSKEQGRLSNGVSRIQDEVEEVLLRWIEAHPRSPVALLALQQYAGGNLKKKRVESLYLSLDPAVRNLPSVAAFGAKIARIKTLVPGSTALEFTQADTAGLPVSLSSFRGKYVLVDFWASWCKPCREENPHLVTAYHNFKDQNFTILSVSLDQPNGREKWLKAIHDDQLTWTHVSDLKFWNNEVAQLYAIQAVPENFLIDPDGVIIARGLRGKELEQKLRKVLKK